MAEGDDISAIFGNTEYTWDITYQGNGSISGGGNDVMLTDLSTAVIPEPASFALLGLGGLAMLPRRRR